MRIRRKEETELTKIQKVQEDRIEKETERIPLKYLFFSEAARRTIQEMEARLKLFSEKNGKKQKPKTWGELGSNGILVVKTKAKSSQGEYELRVDIPQEHWGYLQ